jgi:hypothetical protein
MRNVLSPCCKKPAGAVHVVEPFSTGAPSMYTA